MQRAFAPLHVSGRLSSDGQLSVYFSRSGSRGLSGIEGGATNATLRITAFRWSGGSGAVEHPAALPAADGTAKLFSGDIDGVLSTISCGARARCCDTQAECVLRLEVVVPAAAQRHDAASARNALLVVHVVARKS